MVLMLIVPVLPPDSALTPTQESLVEEGPPILSPCRNDPVLALVLWCWPRVESMGGQRPIPPGPRVCRCGKTLACVWGAAVLQRAQRPLQPQGCGNAEGAWCLGEATPAGALWWGWCVPCAIPRQLTDPAEFRIKAHCMVSWPICPCPGVLIMAPKSGDGEEGQVE